LAELVTSVGEINQDFMIRVGMMNPMYMPKIREGLLEAFENPKVFKFLHIPVQSGSNRILKEMKRGHTAKVFKDTAEKFQKKFGKFTISTDIIVGFPTESEEDFQQTIELINDVKPDVINLSRYSARPGTKAAKMKQLDVSEIKRRSKIVFEMAKTISYERNKEWIGWRGQVLFDEISDGKVKGRNFAYKPVVINEKASLGEKIQVEITKITQHGLFGKTLS
jgi:MiaB/RimO family radical SAM methylthiotransferase